MKIVIPGGTGQVGVILARAFHRDGHELTVLSRSSQSVPWQVVNWDGKTIGDWVAAIDGADLVVNLAGYTVNCRYNETNRQRIMNSRIDSTRVIGQAIRQSARPPATWMQASTATIYAHSFDVPNDETNGIIGGREENVPDTWKFSIDVATAWERAVDEFELPKTRQLKLRSAIILSPDRGGIFDELLRLVRFGLGGTAGRGDQFVSWVHYKDFVRAVYWLVEHEEISDVVNIASPNPLPNQAFMKALREAWGIPFGLSAPEWMLEVGALLMRTETELILKSRRVVPGLLLENGFSFQHPSWPQAAESLCAEWRAVE
jgi:hypothetical protein